MTTPASPRVAEDELVTEVSKLICFAERKYCGVPMCQKECKAPMSNHAHMKRDKIATAIITLAGDAKLKEVAEWAEQWAATLELHKADASRQRAQGALVVASHLRAMMAKP